MAYFYYFIICIFLILLQTTDLSSFLFFAFRYDFLILIILYLGVYRPFIEGILTLFFVGLIMDSLSGGPFGLYMTIYFWLFIGVRWAIQYLHVGSAVLLPCLIASGILLENIIFIGTVAVLDPDFEFSSYAMQTINKQVLWAACTGPFLIIFIKYCHEKLDKCMDMLFPGSHKALGLVSEDMLQIARLRIGKRIRRTR